MELSPLCEGARALGHSWGPSFHWWWSLTAGDQGAWVAGLGAFSAAFVAVVLSRREEIRRNRESKLRGRLTAAYLYVPFFRIKTFAVAVETHSRNIASVMAGEASKNVLQDVFLLEKACEQIRPLRDKFDLSEVTYIDEKTAIGLAVVVGRIDQLMDVIAATAAAFHAAESAKDPNDTRFKAGQNLAIVLRWLPGIVQDIEIFLAYCKKIGVHPGQYANSG